MIMGLSNMDKSGKSRVTSRNEEKSSNTEQAVAEIRGNVLMSFMMGMQEAFL